MKITELPGFWSPLVKTPEQALTAEKGKGGLGDALKIIGVIYAIFGALFALAFFAMGALMFGSMSTLAGGKAGALIAGLGAAIVLVIFLVVIVFGILGFLVGSGVMYVLAKLLGGKGSFGSQTYLLSLVSSASIVLSLVSFMLMLIPCIGFLLSMLVSLLSLYLLYVTIIAIKVEHGLSTLKAVVAVLVIPLLLGIVVFVVMAVVLWNLGVFNPSTATQAAGFSVLRPVSWSFQGTGFGSGNTYYATQATVAFANIAGIDLTVGVNGKPPSSNRIIKFSKPGVPNCGWYGDVNVVDELGSSVPVSWDSSNNYGKVAVPAGGQVTISGLITGPNGPDDSSQFCGGPSGGSYRWTVTYQTAVDQYGIQHSDSGSVTGKFQ